MSRPVRVLLLWPGSEGAAAGNFGVPQLVLLGTYLRSRANVDVEIRDLAIERRVGTSLAQIIEGDDGKGYDIVAISIYSSFDHLPCGAIADMVRQRWPDVVLVAGGYHASARPLAYIGEQSSFDAVVVGEGERPLLRIVESVAGGAPIRNQVLGPEAIEDLDTLPPSDWSLLARYRNVARHYASQAQVYLSRGCPFDCAFCMERAKRETSWRSLSVERALDEIDGLHRFINLDSWTLYFGDALFGMKKRWRREFLEGLARRGYPVHKYWLLIRVDLVEDEDLRLFSEANCGLGFGLESGDPALLSIIRKSGRLDSYLQRMEDIAEQARVHQVPWGANVICGHPGETPDSMRRSAEYLRRLFVRPQGTTGFLSIDPFRLYPGSPIDAQRDHYEQQYGTRFHRPHWWDDGDPEFLAEWVDPSAELDWSTREALQHELFTPILAQIEDHFAYTGPARDYFMGAIRDQLAYTGPRSRMRSLERYYAWHGYLGQRSAGQRQRRTDTALHDVAATLRARQLPAIAKLTGLPEDCPIIEALRVVPRERFVPLESIASSIEDIAIALDDSKLATVSAMHAYAASFAQLDLRTGDRVLDLGSGTGYGSALLHQLVGPTGDVVALEIDPRLVATAHAELAPLGVQCEAANALDPQTWPPQARGIDKVTVGFALSAIPTAWHAYFTAGTTVVAPVAHEGALWLCRLHRAEHGWDRTPLFEVRYVPARTEVPQHVPPPPDEVLPPPRAAAPTRLTVLD